MQWGMGTSFQKRCVGPSVGRRLPAGIASGGVPSGTALYELAPSPASIWMRSLRYRKSDWIQLTRKLVYSEF